MGEAVGLKGDAWDSTPPVRDLSIVDIVDASVDDGLLVMLLLLLPLLVALLVL